MNILKRLTSLISNLLWGRDIKLEVRLRTTYSVIKDNIESLGMFDTIADAVKHMGVIDADGVCALRVRDNSTGSLMDRDFIRYFINSAFDCGELTRPETKKSIDIDWIKNGF